MSLMAKLGVARAVEGAHGMGRRAFCGLALAGGAAVLAGLAGCGAQQDAGATLGEHADGQDASAAAQDDSASQAASQDAPASTADPVKASTFAFNTLVNITAYGVDESAVSECIKACATYETCSPPARRAPTSRASMRPPGSPSR